jgi:hypothetical protein
MAAKKKSALRKKTAAKRKSPARRQTAANRKAPARKQTASKKKASGKKQTASNRKTSGKKQTASNRNTSAKKQTASNKKTSAKKKSIVRGRAAGKKKPAARRRATLPKPGIIQKIASIFTPSPAVGPLTIITESLPGFTVGQPKKFTIEASGGQPPYKFQLTGGTLPPNLQFSPRGTLSGTALNAGDTTIWVKVTDTARPQGHLTQAFDLQVEPAA